MVSGSSGTTTSVAGTSTPSADPTSTDSASRRRWARSSRRSPSCPIYLSTRAVRRNNADFAAIRQRITKPADASPAFEAIARRREATAHAAGQDGDLVTALVYTGDALGHEPRRRIMITHVSRAVRRPPLTPSGSRPEAGG